MPLTENFFNNAVQVFLLTHERELFKANNSGRLVNNVLGEQCQQIIWQRREPDTHLLALAEAGELALLHPEGEVIDADCLPQNIVLIDATWQQAGKIYRQSAYLQQLPRFRLPPGQVSAFTRRRNQPPGCLCTAEAVTVLLNEIGERESAEKLEQAFAVFNQTE
jgi:DTW domain-containing protein YfiP